MCVKNNAPSSESHCGTAENATDNYTELPKSMPAGRAPGEGELAGGQVTVTPSQGSHPMGAAPVLYGCGLDFVPMGLESPLCAIIFQKGGRRRGTERQTSPDIEKHGTDVSAASLVWSALGCHRDVWYFTAWQFLLMVFALLQHQPVPNLETFPFKV